MKVNDSRFTLCHILMNKVILVCKEANRPIVFLMRVMRCKTFTCFWVAPATLIIFELLWKALVSSMPLFSSGEHLCRLWFSTAFMKIWIIRGRNHIKIMSIKKLELWAESCDQIMTGCKHVKGWIIVRITNNVVKTSILAVFDEKWSNLK